MCENSILGLEFFNIYSNVKTGRGLIIFLKADATLETTRTLPIYRRNGLWYLQDCFEYNGIQPTVRRLNRQQEAELWSLRLGSPGTTQLETITNHSTGMPSKLRLHPFRIIPEVADAKIMRQHRGQRGEDRPVSRFGERFHMDFGFFRASTSDYNMGTGTTGRVICSRDGYTANLLIVDAYTRMMYTFPTRGKNPPVDIVDQFCATCS